MEKIKELTDSQEKGIDLVIKALNKKFPFIIDWGEYKHWREYSTTLFIDLVVDLNKYGQYLKDKFNVNLLDHDLLVRHYKDLINFFGPINDIEKEVVRENIRNLNDYIKEYSNVYYDALPNNYKLKYREYDDIFRILGIGQINYVYETNR